MTAVLEDRELDGYGLRGPKPADALAQLSRVLGAQGAEAAWRPACRSVGVDPSAQQLSITDLIRVAEQLSRQGGLVGVLGNSFWIRCQTFDLLERKQRLKARSSAAGGVR